MPKAAYTDDAGVTHPIRLSGAVLTAGAFTANDPATSRVPAKVSKSKREFGLGPRGVHLSRNIGTAAVPNMRYKFLPIATPAAALSSLYAENAVVAIDGTNWTVGSFKAEDY